MSEHNSFFLLVDVLKFTRALEKWKVFRVIHARPMHQDNPLTSSFHNAYNPKKYVFLLLRDI